MNCIRNFERKFQIRILMMCNDAWMSNVYENNCARCVHASCVCVCVCLRNSIKLLHKQTVVQWQRMRIHEPHTHACLTQTNRQHNARAFFMSSFLAITSTHCIFISCTWLQLMWCRLLQTILATRCSRSLGADSMRETLHLHGELQFHFDLTYVLTVESTFRPRRKFYSHSAQLCRLLLLAFHVAAVATRTWRKVVVPRCQIPKAVIRFHWIELKREPQTYTNCWWF